MEEVKQSKWYVLHTYAGYEAIVKASIEQMVANNNLQNVITDIKIPTEQIVEERNGKKKVVEAKAMPCYVFVKIIYSPHIWYLLTNTRGVTGFVGPQGKAWELTEEEVRRLKLEVIKFECALSAGQSVRVVGGAFEGHIGMVKSIDQQRQKVTVALSMFGREIDTDMEFDQVLAIDK